MSAINYLTLLSTIVVTSSGTPVPPGYINIASTNSAPTWSNSISTSGISGSTILVSSITTSTITVSSLGYSTISGSTINAQNITLSTLTVSSINSGAPGVGAYSTFNASSLNVMSTLTTSTLTVSTMTGSTLTISRLTGLIISASSITSSDLVLSTLTVSSINGLAPGTGSGGSGGTTIFSTLGVSSLNAISTITTSTLTTTSNVGIGTATPQAPLHVYKAGGGIGNNTLQGEIRVCSDDNQISRIGCYEEPNGTTWGGFFQYNGGGTDLIQIGGKSSGVDQYYMAIQRISGNIGIGTTNPSHTLQVAGAINCSSFLVNGTAVATGTGSVWGVSGSSAYYTSGNVGIGTVSPSNSLTIYAGGSAQYIRSNSSVITGCYSEWRDFSATGRFIIGCDGAGLANFELGAGIIGTWSVNSVIFLTNAAERMRITSDGVVGIGVTNPASGYTTAIPNARLTIRGGTAGQNNGAARLSIGGDNAHYAAIEGAHTSGGASTLAFMTCLNAGTNSANPETRMFINSNGNVGIGTVNPSHLLQVAGAINCTSFLVNGTAVATGTGSVWGVSGSVAYYTSGFVGISTTAPNTNLHVRVPTYANPVFIVDAGGQGTDTTPPRGIGKPLIGVGAYSWSNISSGDYYGIGFGYNANNNAASYYPGEIGFLIQNTGGGEFGDLVFSTRPTTTNTTIASERMRITSGGLIGIGTTNPNAILDIYGSFRILSKPYVALTSGTGIEFVYDGGGNLTCGTRSSSAPTLTTTNMNYAAASHAFYIGSQAGTNALVISSTGNVGIGTATPGNKLHIYSTTANDGILFQNAFNSSTGSIKLYTTTAAGNHILDGTADAGVVLPTDGKDLFLGRTTSLNTSMVVKGGTGFVGIGTASPNSQLQVYGTAGASSTTTLSITNGFNSNTNFGSQLVFSNIQNSGATIPLGSISCLRTNNTADYSAYLAFSLGNILGNGSSYEVMRINASGNMGIGTTVPQGPLHVYNSSGWSLIRATTSSTSWASALLIDPAGTVSPSTPSWFIGERDTAHGPLSIWAFNGTVHQNNAVTISATGNVGIGTVTPGFKLDVAGAVQINTSVATGLTCTSSASEFVVNCAGNGPFSIDPNHTTNSYVRVWDQLTVTGNFSVSGTKSFSIPHPYPPKRDQGYYLYHSCLETPNAGDTIERFQVSITNDSLHHVITMPDYYYYMCNNIMVLIQSVDTFGRSKYHLERGDTTQTVEVHVDVSEAGMYNIIVIGTRCDKEVQRGNFQLEKIHENGVRDIIDRSIKKERECLYCSDCCPDEHPTL